MNTQTPTQAAQREPSTPAHSCRLAGLCCGIRLSHLGLLVLVFGLLLWARFLLVTGHPRTAVADPHQLRGLPPAAASTAAAQP